MPMPNWFTPFIWNVQKAGNHVAEPGLRRAPRQTVEGPTIWPTHGDGRVLERCFSGSA
jgi:hypothetical protein